MNRGATLAGTPEPMHDWDMLSEADAQAFLAVCPKADYACVGSAAHMLAGERNDLFADAVIAFLARAVPVLDDIT